MMQVPLLNIVVESKNSKEAERILIEAFHALDPDLQVEILGEWVKIGDTLRVVALVVSRLRVKKGLSMRKAARLLGSESGNSIARYERGEAVPSLDKMQELLDALGDSLELAIVDSREAV